MNLLLPDSGLIFWMTIIFAIVFLILAKFGFPVITGMVEKRTKRIDGAIAAARKAEESLAGAVQEQERLLAEAKDEHTRILQSAASERDNLIARAKEEARGEAEKILEEARKQIQQEKETVLRDVRREVAVLSVAIAEKIVRKELSSDKGQQELIDRTLDDLLSRQSVSGQESVKSQS